MGKSEHIKTRIDCCNSAQIYFLSHNMLRLQLNMTILALTVHESENLSLVQKIENVLRIGY